MKNRTAKILSAVLALCLVICAVFTITAFAAGTIDDALNSDGVYDFENAPLGTVASGSKVVLAGTAANVTHTIVEDDDHGQVYQWVKTGTAYTSADGIKFYGTPKSGVNTVVLNFKMRITDVVAHNNPIRISLYAGTTATVNVDVRRDGSKLTAGGSNFEQYLESANDWFDFSVVYYEGDTEPTTSNKDLTCGGKATVFVNGNFVHEYATASLNRTHKAESVNNLNIGAVNATRMTVCFDDIKIEHKNVVTPEIVSANVSYSDNVYIHYAVRKDSISTGETPKLVGTDKYGSFTINEYTEQTVNGVSCYVFKSRGVPAKELNTTETVKIVAGDAMSESVTYSVEQYLFNKLYDEGYIAEAEEDNAAVGENDGKDFIRMNVYLNLLEYGYYAQQLLGENITDAIADKNYVSINGTTADYSGDDAAAEYTLTPSDAGVTEFKVVTSDAFGKVITIETVAAGETITINGFTCVYPVK